MTSSEYLVSRSGANGRIPIGVSASASKYARTVRTPSSAPMSPRRPPDEKREPHCVCRAPVANARDTVVKIGEHRPTDGDYPTEQRQLVEPEDESDRTDRCVDKQHDTVVAWAMHRELPAPLDSEVGDECVGGRTLDMSILLVFFARKEQ